MGGLVEAELAEVHGRSDLCKDQPPDVARTAPPVASISAVQPFLTGDQVRIASGWANIVLGPPQPREYYRTFKDLDTGREIPWPKDLPDRSEAKGDEIAAFAAKEGFDLMGHRVHAAGFRLGPTMLSGGLAFALAG